MQGRDHEVALPLVYRRHAGTALEIDLARNTQWCERADTLQIEAVAEGDAMLYFVLLAEGCSVRPQAGNWLAVDRIMADIQQCIQDQLTLQRCEAPNWAEALAERLRTALQQFSAVATVTDLRCDYGIDRYACIDVQLRLLDGQMRQLVIPIPREPAQA